jgi:cell division protein FtsB
MDGAVLGALIGAAAAILAAVPGILAFLGQRRAVHADVLERMSGAAVTLIEPLQKRIESLEAENADLRRVVEGLARRNARLEGLEFERTRLETRLAVLTARLESLERANHRLTDAVRAYLKSPSREAGRQIEKLLAQFENQVSESLPAALQEKI